MIASIAPESYWIGYPLWLTLSAASDLSTRQRRLSRSATLDGGAVFNDGGFCEADRTLTLTMQSVSRENAATLKEISSYPKVIISISDGLFLCRIKSYVIGGGNESTLTALVESRLS